jgi:hypothetical protein
MEELKVAGEMPTAETWKANRFIGRRVFGAKARWLVFAYGLVGGALALAISETDWAYEHPTLSSFLVLLLFVTSAILGVVHCRRIVKTAPIKRGGLATLTIAFAIEDAGLRMINSLGEALTYWSSFDEIAGNETYWVFIVDRSAYVLPRRFFANPNAERQFIAAALSRLRDDAKARSGQAATFVTAAA